MSDFKCDKCPMKAEYFYRGGSTMMYGCPPHAGPNWRRIDAADGTLHAGELAAAQAHKTAYDERK
ncbi:MAG: hypothetical protein M3O46_05890 [Myxococcota bacterium]|nr:hypothetical protein [Myxococcota bacterium]